MPGREQDREDGRQRARDEGLAVRLVSPVLPGVMGAWEVTGRSGRTYRVTIYDPDGRTVTCECPDFRIRRTKVCKHIAAVLSQPAGKGGP